MDDEQLFRFFTINLCWKRDAQLIQVYPWKERLGQFANILNPSNASWFEPDLTQTLAQTIFYGLRVQKFRSCNHKWWCLGFCWRWCQQKNREVHCHSPLWHDVNSTAGRWAALGFLRCATARSAETKMAMVGLIIEPFHDELSLTKFVSNPLGD